MLSVHQIGQGRPLKRGEKYAGHIGAGRSIEQTGRKHQEEIRPEAVPADLADARDRDGQGFTGDVELEGIAELQVQGLLVLR